MLALHHWNAFLVIVVCAAASAAAFLARRRRVAFFLAIALVAYTLWRDFGRREIGLWPARAQRVFYGAVGLFVVDLGWFFIRGVSGPDALVFFVVAGACIYAALRTWRDQNRY